MAPKRKEKETEVMIKQKPDPIKTDNDALLLAFEKPTQIYRYLRTRNMISPIFLHRNLTYMKNRMSRSHKKRSTFKVDTIKDIVEARERKSNGLVLPNKHLTLLFMGFYDKQLEDIKQDAGQVKVDVILIKNAQNKRKETSAAVQQIVGSTEVKVNPNDISTINRTKIPAISIPIEQFDTNCPSPVTHTLIFRIEHCPNNILMENGKEDEPCIKKSKTNVRNFTVDLLIIEKNKCVIDEGEYELMAQDAIVSNLKFYSPKKLSTESWETINLQGFPDLDDLSYDDVFNKEPLLKFYIKWTPESLAGLVERPPPIKFAVESNKENCPNGNGVASNNNNNNNHTSAINGIENGVGGGDIKPSGDEQKPFKIIYHFVYNNNSLQQTEQSSRFECPWCNLDCAHLYALLKHLKLCHARFLFTYFPITDGARIDVSINELYDGSYTGSPHDLLKSGGFSRSVPVRRSTVTNILVCRPRRVKPSLSEFLEMDENEFDSQRPYITGHCRLYHHTMTCLPVLPKELDIDSEGEADPGWLQTKTMQMIDEFTDVNEGEKELMKLWNLHVMKHGYVGDCQIPIACEMFVELKGRELLEKNLYRNFILHISSLFDFGLISPENFYTTIQKIQKILNEYEEAQLQMAKRNKEQSEYWKTVGVFKQIEQQKLAEEQKKKELEQQKLLDDKKLVVTATDVIKASNITLASPSTASSSGSNKTVNASIKTTSITTAVINNNNKQTNGTTATKDRKNHNSNTNNTPVNHSTNHNKQNHTQKSGTTKNSSGGSTNNFRGVKRRNTDQPSEGTQSLKRRRSAGSIPSNSPMKNQKITNRRSTITSHRLRSTTNLSTAKPISSTMLPTIVLPRKLQTNGITSSSTGNGMVKTRQSTGK